MAKMFVCFVLCNDQHQTYVYHCVANQAASDPLCSAAFISSVSSYSSVSSSPLSPPVSHYFVSSLVSTSFSSCLLPSPFPSVSSSPPPELVMELYPRRPQLVEQKALPLLWGLLGPSSGSVHRATTSLCRALHHQMGPGLRQSAASQPPSVGRDLNQLLRTMS